MNHSVERVAVVPGKPQEEEVDQCVLDVVRGDRVFACQRRSEDQREEFETRYYQRGYDEQPEYQQYAYNQLRKWKRVSERLQQQ